MSQAGTGSGTSLGYTIPSVTQFSIFLANKVGKMMELVKGFDEHHCRICALAVHEASDHAVVRIVPNDATEARKILNEQNLPFMESEILVICFDQGHTLSSMCEFLLRAELSIRFMYPLMAWSGSTQTLALAVDDLTLAGQILRRKEFRLLGEADLPRAGE
ncbi:MAG: hypothetical protein K2X32_10050 [Phycisphaerales bacterium]|jgi:hypothetical protein|nr:hypothetical protein [Phycisphaerales bacterium]